MVLNLFKWILLDICAYNYYQNKISSIDMYYWYKTSVTYLFYCYYKISCSCNNITTQNICNLKKSTIVWHSWETLNEINVVNEIKIIGYLRKKCYYLRMKYITSA